jgi:superfamily II DNA or RNA helicase
VTAAALPQLFDELAFGGEWRRYQKAAIAGFERDRASGRRRTHIVAPAGVRQTLVGVELVRRAGRRALVLAPNGAVQMQWPRAVRQFAPAAEVGRTAGAEPAFPIACMTYQSLCQLDDPEVALGRVAVTRWAAERAAATGVELEAARREGERYEGAAAERRAREIARITAAVKREIARGEHAGVELADLLSATAKARVAALRAGRVGMVVLDECHHLASMWGYVVRAVLDELGGEDVHVVGLTATPPSDLTGEESELYAELLGPVDYTVPTPAVVRDGHLAPYQELAWLTEPLSGERAWLAEHDTRFKELITALHEDADGPLSFPGWVITRLRERRRSADDDAQVPWEDFQHRSPRLARAGVRFLGSAGLAPPEGAPRGEAYRRPPDLEDWLALLEDYALRCLHPSAERAAGDRYAAVAAALGELGFRLTRQGIRRGTSEVDPPADRLAGQGDRAGGGPRVGNGVARRRAAGTRAVRRRAGRGQARPAAGRRARPGLGHRAPRAGRARGGRADGSASPAGGLRPRASLPAGRRRRPARRARRARRGAPGAARVVGRARRRARFAPLVGRRVGAARLGRAGHACARERRLGRADRHPRAARRGLGLPSGELPRRPDRGHYRRFRAADAGPLAAARPREPLEAGVELGHRVRRPGPRARERGLRAPRAQAHASLCAGRRRRDRGRAVARAPGARPLRPDPGEPLRRRQPGDGRARWRLGAPYVGADLRTLVVRPRDRGGQRDKGGQTPSWLPRESRGV